MLNCNVCCLPHKYNGELNRQNNNIYAIEQKPCPRIDVIFTMLTECVTSCCQIGGLTWLLDSWIGSSLTFSALMFRMILIWAQSIRPWWHPGRPQAASRQYGLYFAVSFSCQTVTNKNILIWYLYFGHRSTAVDRQYIGKFESSQRSDFATVAAGLGWLWRGLLTVAGAGQAEQPGPAGSRKSVLLLLPRCGRGPEPRAVVSPAQVT